jgi:C1A family cysteine protease
MKPYKVLSTFRQVAFLAALALCAIASSAPTEPAAVPAWDRPAPRKMTGLLKPADAQENAAFKAGPDFLVTPAELPEAFDWVDKLGGLTPIRRQVNGDCWAQGTTAVLEGVVKAATGVSDPLSVQEIISCSGDGSAAGGGYFAHDYQQSHGQSVEADFPYKGYDVRCKRGLVPKYRLKAWGYVGAHGRSATNDEIKQAMMQHGVLGTTIYANRALSNYHGGVFHGCGHGGTNHIEVLVGWNDKMQDGTSTAGVWHVRNSWGTGHGDKGYDWIPYGCSRVGEDVTWVDLQALQDDGTYRDLNPMDSFWRPRAGR